MLSTWIPARVARAPVLILGVTLITACGGNPPPETEAGMPAPDMAGLVAGDDVLTRNEIEMIHASTMEQLFDGRFSGVLVIPRGSTFSLSIRGAGEPLVVIDGVPTAGTRELSSLNPVNVERIEILKGPTANIYGIRGRNGVVMVTTRRT